MSQSLRAQYVEKLNNLVHQGRQIVWMDETNFNLFCRRTVGRAKIGDRAKMTLPASRGPNIHVIGAISLTGVLKMDTRRGSFTADLANNWVQSLIEEWTQSGNQLADLVIVVDNAPCHSRLEQVFQGIPATLLRLAPYSPMLNPIETIWSKVKSHVKANLLVPSVQAPGVTEQRIQYLMNVIDGAKGSIQAVDCARAVQHSTALHPAALAMEDMNVGM